MSVALRPDQSPTRWQQRIAVHTLDQMNPVIVRILEGMAGVGFTDKECFGARLSLEEAIVNGLKHGNKGDASKAVHIRFTITDRQVDIEVEDQGPGFNPDKLPDPLAPENLERPGGRGVFLMRHYMTWVAYNERGNLVAMRKTR